MSQSIIHLVQSAKEEQVKQWLMAIASVFNNEFSVDWLVELSGVKANRILSELDTEVKNKVLISDHPGVYRFTSEADRDQFRKVLSIENKADLDRQIANIYLRDLPAGDEKFIEAARHLINVNNDIDGCRTLIKAGNIYRHLFNNKDAFQYYTKVIDDLRNLVDAEADRLFSETAINYSKIASARHETPRVLAVLEDALTRAKRQGNLPVQSLLEMHISKNEWLRANYDQSDAHFKRGLAVANKLNDPQFIRFMNPFVTFFMFYKGKLKEAMENYEKALPDIEKYPERPFPLMAAMVAGYCYALTGKLSHGLGMMDSIRAQCLKKGDRHLASMVIANIGDVMLSMHRLDEAEQYIKEALKMAMETQNRWVWMACQIMMAFLNYCKGEKKRAASYLTGFIKNSKEMDTTVPYPYLLELSYAVKVGSLPQIEGISVDKEVEASLQSHNIFFQGLAFRYQAMLLANKIESEAKIVASFLRSIKLLAETGHVIELARSRVELARYYLSRGDESKARKLTGMAYKVLSPINDELLPGDLRGMIPSHPEKGEYVLNKILAFGRQVVHILDNRELMRHIISIINQITGAERGAIFLLDSVAKNGNLTLRASKNLTQEEINHPDFKTSMQMIKETARTGRGIVYDIEAKIIPAYLSGEAIRSIICVPMVLRDKVIGILYHDNRLLSSAFKESDIEILSYFSAFAAIALDNARAYEEITKLNRKLQEEKNYYEEKHVTSLHFDNIVGGSPAINKVLEKIKQVADTEATVLIVGETGVGKELVARAIHRLSSRRDKPFISVQLSSLSESLMPSELFGHEKGSFTGATQRRIGRFELADGGTLFLDEIGDASEEIQIRLLRILQTRQFERVGGTEKLTSNFRLITATNRNLAQEIKNGKFRQDLYYRLNIFPILVPPLRERKEDVPMLAHHFLKINSEKVGKKINTISKQSMEKLIQYQWPGNVRELENVIERGVILSRDIHFFLPEAELAENSDASSDTSGTLADNERRHILRTLEKTGWKISGAEGAAKLLDIPPSTLAFRMKKLGIKKTDYRN